MLIRSWTVRRSYFRADGSPLGSHEVELTRFEVGGLAHAPQMQHADDAIATLQGNDSVFFLLVGLAGFEWGLRRRKGLA